MIFKLGMKHQGEELYEVYINHDPAMTCVKPILRQGQPWLPMNLNGENCQNVN